MAIYHGWAGVLEFGSGQQALAGRRMVLESNPVVRYSANSFWLQSITVGKSEGQKLEIAGHAHSVKLQTAVNICVLLLSPSLRLRSRVPVKEWSYSPGVALSTSVQ